MRTRIQEGRARREDLPALEVAGRSAHLPARAACFARSAKAAASRSISEIVRTSAGLAWRMDEFMILPSLRWRGGTVLDPQSFRLSRRTVEDLMILAVRREPRQR